MEVKEYFGSTSAVVWSVSKGVKFPGIEDQERSRKKIEEMEKNRLEGRWGQKVGAR